MLNTIRNNKQYNIVKLQPRKNIASKKYINSMYQEIICLIKRYYIQIKRRPSSLFSGIVQPMLWLILFGALFQNAPINLLTQNNTYYQFLSPGIIVFSSFTGAINSGLPLMFDREFGFLNRLLVAPLKSRDSLLFSSIIFIATITSLQTSFIIISSLLMDSKILSISQVLTIFIILLLITLSIGSISICLAFTLPGHIEFLAVMLIANLPTLFSSTALAPLSFMPYWLQIIASLNPLTYAIESIRFLYYLPNIEYESYIIKTAWFDLNINNSIFLLVLITITCFYFVKNIIIYKCD
uniref:ABC transporter n=1 Tax=Agarophyton chilense TaxID=2510777 RepID=A0A141SEW9_AGACH|nr:ABC-2 type transporter [Agarophyton chilense]AMK96837.1 ABC-2 type transporter [Agarophyton chilense]ASP44731.1 ABC transporter [Agarophyton chilense]UAD84437.1 ABC transporter [Agarophyton chilense]